MIPIKHQYRFCCKNKKHIEEAWLYVGSSVPPLFFFFFLCFFLLYASYMSLFLCLLKICIKPSSVSGWNHLMIDFTPFVEFSAHFLILFIIGAVCICTYVSNWIASDSSIFIYIWVKQMTIAGACQVSLTM